MIFRHQIRFLRRIQKASEAIDSFKNQVWKVWTKSSNSSSNNEWVLLHYYFIAFHNQSKLNVIKVLSYIPSRALQMHGFQLASKKFEIGIRIYVVKTVSCSVFWWSTQIFFRFQKLCISRPYRKWIPID